MNFLKSIWLAWTGKRWQIAIQHLESIMTTLQDLKDALAKVADDATAEKAEVATAIKGLTDEIAALKDRIANGVVVTSDDLDALISTVTGIGDQVQSITVPVVAEPQGGGGPGSDEPGPRP